MMPNSRRSINARYAGTFSSAPDATKSVTPRISRTLNKERPSSQLTQSLSPLRRASTLEGRTRLICITPSRTRESWLSRGRSPSHGSTMSVTAGNYVSRYNNLPNSLSDGALMRRLMTNPQQECSSTTGLHPNPLVEPKKLPHLASNDLHELPQFSSEEHQCHPNQTLPMTLDVFCAQPEISSKFTRSSKSPKKVVVEQCVPRPTIPKLGTNEHTSIQARPLQPVNPEIVDNQSADHKLGKLSPLHSSGRRKAVSISERPKELKLTTVSGASKRTTVPQSCIKVSDNKNPSTDKPSFTKHIFTEDADTCLKKPNGQVFEYPLNTWFVTSQPGYNDTFTERQRQGHFIPSSNTCYDISFELYRERPAEFAKVATASNRRANSAEVQSASPVASPRSNELSQAADVIIWKHQRELDVQPSHPSDCCCGSSCGRRKKPRNKTRVCAPLATEEEESMNNSSGDTNSSVSEKRGTSFLTRRPQPLVSRDKPKTTDRRATPRQIKQQKHISTTADSKVVTSGAHTGGEKFVGSHRLAKSNSLEQANNIDGSKQHSGDIASSLLRTASLHLRTTWSKLKRSNSGQSGKQSPIDLPNLNERRSSDPSSKSDTQAENKIRLKQAQGDIPPLTMDNFTMKSPSRSRHSAGVPKTPPSPDESPLPPGCSRWSTKLDPPPPASPGRSIPHSCGPLIFRQSGNFGSKVDTSEISKHIITSSPYVPQELISEWKGRPFDTVFRSLPLGESDDLNHLTDDCIDVGELGRVNCRTGSFTGRYPNPRRQRCPFPSAQYLQQRELTPQSNFTRLSPSRPLYLSPYQASSSGNTTRSAPSPSLSSMTSTSLPVATEPCLLRTNTMSLQQSRLNTGSTQPTNRINYGQAATSFDELDPVLDRLLSDVSSIDKYRSALRPQNTSVRLSSKNEPAQSFPQQANRSMSDDQTFLTPSNMRSPFGRSDPGTVAPRRVCTDDNWDLKKEINDLIQLEFSCQPQRSSPVRSIPKTQTEKLDENTGKSRLSEPNVTADSELLNSVGFGPRSRQHPFRWSSGTRTNGGHKSNVSPSTHTENIRPQPSILIHRAETVTSIGKAVSTDQMIHSGKLQIAAEQTTNTTDESPPPEAQLDESLWSSGQESGETVSLWSLTANQLARLRKLALVQISSLAEKHCANRSPFNWRFLKYRGTGINGDQICPSSPNDTSPTGHRRVELHISSPPFSTSAVELTNSSLILCASTTAVSPASSAAEDKRYIIPNRWTSYEGPVFGQSLESWQQRLGYPLPSAILHMMDHIERVGASAHGIFRRPGGKVRTKALRDLIEKDLCWANFEEWQPFDVADLLKQFFRELPECLLTDKLSLILVNVYGCVSASTQWNLLRWVLLGLPDDNRVVLQKLLHLLHSLVRYSDVTQMSASNLAVCFAPSLFRFASSTNAYQGSTGFSPRRLRRTTSGPDPKDLADQRTAQLSLTAMIAQAPALFEISTDILRRTCIIPNRLEPRSLDTIIPGSSWPTWIQAELGRLIRECSASRSKNWTVLNKETWKLYQTGSGAGENLEGLEVHYRKPTSASSTNSSPSLRTWRCSLPIPESEPKKIFEHYWYHRQSWDPDISRVQVLDAISDCVEVCLITQTTTPPQPSTGFHVLRGHQCVLDDGGCAILCESVSHSESDSSLGLINTMGRIYQDHVYVRPHGDKSGCRVYLISRVDLK
ncbi:hypothetical protein EG68_06165 [Paragonimus skrjabini miyazakii]|uniref:Rho-GAP domain-containing protein n=1 Tax=Paragonimus skrjabini miyazakii TaxID=59628 RepID=A0A8S9YBK1_9TREM|nr:hypothetical protein EG68_06165 [Paragonimus skrjabini miyazakii]